MHVYHITSNSSHRHSLGWFKFWRCFSLCAKIWHASSIQLFEHRRISLPSIWFQERPDIGVLITQLDRGIFVTKQNIHPVAKLHLPVVLGDWSLNVPVGLTKDSRIGPVFILWCLVSSFSLFPVAASICWEKISSWASNFFLRGFFTSFGFRLNPVGVETG